MHYFGLVWPRNMNNISNESKRQSFAEIIHCLIATKKMSVKNMENTKLSEGNHKPL